MFSAYIQALRICPDWDTGNTLAKVLPGIEALKTQQIDELIAAYNETSELRGSFGFNGSNPYFYGSGLISHLNRLGSRQFKFAAGRLGIDEFCALAVNPNVEQEMQAAERDLAAARQQDPVRDTPPFQLLTLPTFDVSAIEQVLQAGLPELDAAAAARVQAHLATAGRGAEEWIGEGMRRQAERPPEQIGECVFCAQDLAGSPVIGHYRAFFSNAYRQLQRNIVGTPTASRFFARSGKALTPRQRSRSRFPGMEMALRLSRGLSIETV